MIVDGEVLFEAGHVISGEDALKCSGNVIGWSIKGSDGAISIASYSLYGKNGLNIKFESPYYYADSPTLIMTSLFDGNISFSYRGDGTGTSYSYIDIDAWYKIDGTSTKFVACRNEISGNLAEWQEISRDLTALTDFEMWMYLDYAYFDDEYHNSLYVSDIEFTPSVPVP